MSDDPDDTAELRIQQTRKAQAERAAAEASPDDETTHEHDRRAEQAAYLAAKLAEREQTESS